VNLDPTRRGCHTLSSIFIPPALYKAHSGDKKRNNVRANKWNTQLPLTSTCTSSLVGRLPQSPDKQTLREERQSPGNEKVF